MAGLENGTEVFSIVSHGQRDCTPLFFIHGSISISIRISIKLLIWFVFEPISEHC